MFNELSVLNKSSPVFVLWR